jgi:hypothetical protein
VWFGAVFSIPLAGERGQTGSYYSILALEIQSLAVEKSRAFVAGDF